MANKLGLQDDGERLLRVATEVTVQDWLRWQREGRTQRLVQAVWQGLVDEYGLDAEEAGRLLASKAEPEPEPTPEPEPPAPAAKPPPPPASPLPSRPPPAVNVGPALRKMTDAISGPVLVPPPALARKLAVSKTDCLASGARLGIPLKGQMQ